MEISIFTFRINRQVVDEIAKRIKSELNLKVSEVGELKPCEEALNNQRGQYDANALISFLDTFKNKGIAIWILPCDIYCQGFNFVFGIAKPYSCAVLSTARLNTVGLIRKEAIHEIGHILGLTHCKEPCVMAYSNSLPEVMRKSDELCEKCRRRLRKLTGKHDTSVQK